MLIPFLCIVFENPILNWLFEYQNGIFTQKYYTFGILLLVVGFYTILGYYFGRFSMKEQIESEQDGKSE